MFLSRVQLLGTPWRHRRLRRSAAVRQDASSPSLWSQNRHLLVSAPSFLHDGHFPGTVRNSMFSPIRLLWCKKKEPGRPAAPRKTNTPIQTTLHDRQSKFFDARLIPPDERLFPYRNAGELVSYFIQGNVLRAHRMLCGSGTALPFTAVTMFMCCNVPAGISLFILSHIHSGTHWKCQQPQSVIGH